MKGFIVLEIAVILIVLFLGAFGLMIAGKMNESIKNQLTGTEVNTTFLTQSGYALDALSSGFILIAGMLFVGAAIAAYFLREHPVFAIFSVLLLFIMIIIAGIFSNAFESFSSSPEFANQTATYTGIISVMNYLPYIVLVFGSIIIIAMFAKGGGGE